MLNVYVATKLIAQREQQLIARTRRRRGGFDTSTETVTIRRARDHRSGQAA